MKTNIIIYLLNLLNRFVLEHQLRVVNCDRLNLFYSNVSNKSTFLIVTSKTLLNTVNMNVTHVRCRSV